MSATIRAIRLDIDGTLTHLELPTGDALVPALREHVGGFVEIAHYARTTDGSRRLSVAMDADGGLLQPENLYVTSLISAIRLKQLPYAIHGPVVLLGALGDAGEHTEVPAPLRENLQRIVDALKTRYAPASS
ncbi:hypothetical protein BX257_4053 [Streptomyces sp. 3212.3]|uniref:hypothetical protein n=1 Tax=Streptomyces sp. 3212.3 TaxID=1938846 RepID=UPI000E26871E|nr:hypothetical protein [Streptomyces sp. 3212.3]REE61474.1 hypothetical protein BX257_4053 [Streptomyces sp. 3212.3]